jgi:hypothetical protein
MVRLATAVFFLSFVLSGCVRPSADEIARNAEAQDKVKRAAENAEWQRTVEPAIKQRKAEVGAGSRRLSPAALAERVANTTANPATQAAYKTWSTCVGQAAGRTSSSTEPANVVLSAAFIVCGAEERVMIGSLRGMTPDSPAAAEFDLVMRRSMAENLQPEIMAIRSRPNVAPTGAPIAPPQPAGKPI